MTDSGDGAHSTAVRFRRAVESADLGAAAAGLDPTRA
jgi:hypothetical protein